MSNRLSMRVVFSLLIAICLVGNVIGTVLLFNLNIRRSDMFEVTCYATGGGLILGEATLLAIWGVLSGEPFVIRMPRALALSVLVLYSWLLGVRIAESTVPIAASIVVSAMAMLLFLIVTAPLWIARRWSRHHIVAESGVDPRREQITLRHVLIWTAVVAGTTAFPKLLVGSQSSQAAGMPPSSVLVEMVAVVAVISLFVATLGFPLTWGVLAARPSIAAWRFVSAVLLLGPPILSEVIYNVVGRQPSLDGRLVGIVGWYGFALAALTMTSTGLWLGRVLGFRFLPMRIENCNRELRTIPRCRLLSGYPAAVRSLRDKGSRVVGSVLCTIAGALVGALLCPKTASLNQWESDLKFRIGGAVIGWLTYVFASRFLWSGFWSRAKRRRYAGSDPAVADNSGETACLSLLFIYIIVGVICMTVALLYHAITP